MTFDHNGIFDSTEWDAAFDAMNSQENGEREESGPGQHRQRSKVHKLAEKHGEPHE